MILRLALSGAAHLAAGAVIGALAVAACKNMRREDAPRFEASPGPSEPPSAEAPPARPPAA